MTYTYISTYMWASSPVAQMVKNLPVVWETQVQSLSQEDPLEKGMATHSSILAWRIPWTEKPGGLQSMGSQRVGQTEGLTLSLFHLTSMLHQQNPNIKTFFYTMFKKKKKKLPG